MADDVLLPFEKDLAGKHVLVTGHTGFTGSWLCLWLARIGVQVTGVALPPPTTPALFDDANVAPLLAGHHLADIRDPDAMRRLIRDTAPDIVLHLAAQPLVREAYAAPVETFATNVMGTVHVLEAARTAGVAGTVCVTTDKVYLNREWIHPYRETDRLGGHDPYSASKASAELAIASYRTSLTSWKQEMVIATARGGNIVGGGDWAANRLVPDLARAAIAGRPLTLRHPNATRPWQHVLCLVHGYLMLMAGIAAGRGQIDGDWNLGPVECGELSVGEVVKQMCRSWPDLAVNFEPSSLHEAGRLALDCTKAVRQLGWQPAWSMAESIDRTAEWYAAYQRAPENAAAVTVAQIGAYRNALAGR
ncbi:MAG: CDP-glucose 4,6-dehydratase [Novosphingobium sp.]